MNINQSIAKVSSVYEKRCFPTEQKKTWNENLEIISQGGVAVVLRLCNLPILNLSVIFWDSGVYYY